MLHIYHKINFSAIIPVLLFADNKPEGYFTLKEAPLDKWEEKTNAAWEAIIARVKKLWDGGMTQSAIAKKLGLSQASVVNMWLSGQRKAANTSAAALFNYLEKLGFDPLSFFEEGDGQPIIHRLGPNAPVEEVKGHDLPTVPVLGTTGAGDPQELFSEKPEFMLEVLPPYAHKGSIALRVEGDSMEPTIKKGAYVGVIPVEEDIIEGGIYLVYIPPFGRVVKRVRIRTIGELELYSDNTAYQPLRVPVEQYEKIVLGRVLWVWQIL